MIIRMFHTMSSGRHDGRVWPPAGVEFEVPDWEGEDLVNGGNAVKVSDSWAEPVAEKVPLDDLKAAAAGDAEAEAEVSTDAEPEPDAEVSAQPSPPRPAASKQEWIDWAVSQGAEWIAATNATKQQLMETYGQRP